MFSRLPSKEGCFLYAHSLSGTVNYGFIYKESLLRQHGQFGRNGLHVEVIHFFIQNIIVRVDLFLHLGLPLDPLNIFSNFL